VVSKKSIGKKIAKLVREGKPKKQAAAYSKPKKKKGY
jgi:hypothetical protein